MLTFSNPGDLLEGSERMMRLTSLQLTVESATLLLGDNRDGSDCIDALIVEAIIEAESAVFLPTEVKK